MTERQFQMRASLPITRAQTTALVTRSGATRKTRRGFEL
jgi:hypothetical protein